jgi:CRISPR-associated endonuclease/helicase Cas3
LNGYRHELGSLVDAEQGDELMLHLVAAHHGHARPHFLPRAADSEALKKSEAAIRAAPGRFARLNDRYGPWGLAYLEALLKAADGWASEERPEDNG